MFSVKNTESSHRRLFQLLPVNCRQARDSILYNVYLAALVTMNGSEITTQLELIPRNINPQQVPSSPQVDTLPVSRLEGDNTGEQTQIIPIVCCVGRTAICIYGNPRPGQKTNSTKSIFNGREWYNESVLKTSAHYTKTRNALHTESYFGIEWIARAANKGHLADRSGQVT
ncbi:hypothetical protein J6590_084256 [Homalodisca vitripennis]|nr:hypothetical protein J6590_084256 [Homalodisca vitripennis]